MRVGIQVSFSTPAHPQTNGKDERFHRSLKAEVVTGRVFTDHAHIQRAFDAWRDIYNTVRPHQGIGMVVPSKRYCPSPRPFPEVLPAIEYSPHDQVAMVQWNGLVKFKGQKLRSPTPYVACPSPFVRMIHTTASTRSILLTID